MSEESESPDLVELVRGALEAASRGDDDALMAFYAPDALLDGTRTFGGTWRGRAAIRGLVEDWRGAYEEVEWVAEEPVDLGNGVVFTVVPERGGPLGVAGCVRAGGGWVSVWVDGQTASLTFYPEADIDEARADAGRLAQERA